DQQVLEADPLAVVGVGGAAAVGVVLLIQAGFGVVEQLFLIVHREGDGHLGGVVGLGGLAGGEVEHRHVGAGGVLLVQRQAGVDQVGGGVPAVFLPVAAGIAVGVKLEGRGAGVQAVHILVGEQVEQVGRIDVFADMHRHGV